ncbi:MAG: PQQ-binding-like beta-propeller repeat protein [Pirellula sp.]
MRKAPCMHAINKLVYLSILLLLSSTQGYSQELLANRFRGDQGLGVYQQCRVEIPWKDPSVTKLDLPGIGNGSPVLWQDAVDGTRAYLLSASTNDATRHVIAVDLANNKVLWTKSYPSTKHRLHQFSTYASSTPAVDPSGIYVAWGEPEHVYVKHLGHDGQERWTRDFGRYVSQHGFATSPMLLDGKLYLLDSQDAEELEPGVEPGEDRMISLDAKTGQTLWERKLPTKRVCYGLPSVRILSDGSKELVCATTALGIFAMDPNTGEIRWNHDCFKQRVCSSTLLVGPLAIATHGSGGGRDNMLVAYDMQAKKERFRIQRAAPYVPTPVALGNLLFLWSDAGIVSCVRLDDGQVLWSERIGGNYYSSPILLGNRLVNVSDTGNVTILAASEKFEKLGTIATEATVRSTLVASQDMLLMRTYEQLWIVR